LGSNRGSRHRKIPFRIFRLAIIKDIPTDRFNQLIEAMTQDGWYKSSEYDGFDAWIDYGKVVLKKDRLRLKFEWDNHTEGSVEGAREMVETIAREVGLPVSYQSRWPWV
jgi:hypothetical protein